MPTSIREEGEATLQAKSDKGRNVGKIFLQMFFMDNPFASINAIITNVCIKLLLMLEICKLISIYSTTLKLLLYKSNGITSRVSVNVQTDRFTSIIYVQSVQILWHHPHKQSVHVQNYRSRTFWSWPF